MVAESEENLEWIVEEKGNEFSCGSGPTAKIGTTVRPTNFCLKFLFRKETVP